MPTIQQARAERDERLAEVTDALARKNGAQGHLQNTRALAGPVQAAYTRSMRRLHAPTVTADAFLGCPTPRVV
jgi:hypothetical protein